MQKWKSETRVEDGGKIFISADGTGSSESSGFSGFVSSPESIFKASLVTRNQQFLPLLSRGRCAVLCREEEAELY